MANQELFTAAHSYATRNRAERKITHDAFRELTPEGHPNGGMWDECRWFIAALPNGRFVPCVYLGHGGLEKVKKVSGESQSHIAAVFAKHNVCVVW
jgi:hypothetical protein